MSDERPRWLEIVAEAAMTEEALDLIARHRELSAELSKEATR